MWFLYSNVSKTYLWAFLQLEKYVHYHFQAGIIVMGVYVMLLVYSKYLSFLKA